MIVGDKDRVTLARVVRHKRNQEVTIVQDERSGLKHLVESETLTYGCFEIINIPKHYPRVRLKTLRRLKELRVQNPLCGLMNENVYIGIKSKPSATHVPHLYSTQKFDFVPTPSLPFSNPLCEFMVTKINNANTRGNEEETEHWYSLGDSGYCYFSTPYVLSQHVQKIKGLANFVFLIQNDEQPNCAIVKRNERFFLCAKKSLEEDELLTCLMST